MDRSTVIFDFVGLCFVIALFSMTTYLAVGSWVDHTPEPEPPTVVVDTLYTLEPNCRRAGRYPLGNAQRDSVAVMLVCLERQP